MTNIMQRHIAAGSLAALLLLPAPGRAEGPTQSPGYDTGSETVTRITGDLYQALDRKQRPALSASPVLLKETTQPYLQSQSVEGTNAARAVCISKGWIDLVNFISHAKAIDAAHHGFFVKAMSRLAVETANSGVPDVQASATRDAWSFATMNRQGSHFNQIVGSLVAIDMAHTCLGHYQKYAAQLTDAQHQPVPINRLVTAAEWHEAVLVGARHALDVGFAVDGLKLALESIDKLPSRPAWRVYFIPDCVDSKEISKLNRDLDKVQKNAFL